MSPTPWTLDEFAIVAAHPTLSDQELSQLVSGRSPNGVGMVRIGLHTFHMNEDGPAQRMFLPKVIRDHLRSTNREAVTCPKCGVRF